MKNKELKKLAYELRQDTVDIIMAGGGGHIGGDMSIMEILVELYFDQMNISPENQNDPDRDLFVLSKGHSVEAYYSVLAKKGFFPLQEVKDQFSKFGSPYIGHPNNKLPGIEMNSGSLGHGLPVCVGTAFTRSWVTENWQRAPSGKQPWRHTSIIWTIFVQSSTVITCRSPVIQKMSWVMKTCMTVSQVSAGMS